MVAGHGRFDTRVIERLGERVFCKVGAEAVYCAALPQAGLGVALKIDDGNNARAAEVAMAAAIEQLLPLDDADAAFMRGFSECACATGTASRSLGSPRPPRCAMRCLGVIERRRQRGYALRPTSPRRHRMANYVLVHGAWHGGWCYRDTAAALRKAGHRVLTPTHTGVGQRAHLNAENITLETHIRDVLGCIEAEELDDVILVGHSYGGMVITGVADRLGGRVKVLVYLDAFVPEHGDSLNGLLPKACRPRWPRSSSAPSAARRSTSTAA